jgi:2'-5' RNA ligase
MSLPLFQMPGYRVHEYLLVLQPHAELQQKIVRTKKEFYELCQASTALTGKPHIPLVRFMQLQMMEDRIINRLHTAAMGFYPFKAELKGFGSFPSHTIYAQVATREPMKALIKQLRPMQRLLKLDKDHTPYFIDEPHITIARNLAPWQYEKAWAEYEHKHFSGRFIARDMLLLKRPHGEMRYHPVQRFEFQNMPVNTRQGELFATVSEQPVLAW